MKKLLLCAAVLGGLALSASAQAQGRVKLGTLSCHESGGWGFIFGSSRAVRCTFSDGTRSHRYEGSISKFGVDVGYQSSGVLIWEVLAPTDAPGPDVLAGHYGGLTAGASVGVGLNANALIGGSNQTIALQPLSIEGTTGLNVAAGIGELTLRSHDD